MKKIWKWLAVAVASVMVVGTALPAAAEEAAPTETAQETAGNTFTSSDGILSIELASENWKEMQDMTHWIVLSDGANVITIDHFSNGENLPETAVANDHYVNVYQAVFSTQNEVFVVTGSAVDAAKNQEICNMIMSLKVLIYDTKQAVNKTSANSGDIKIEPVNKTMYTTEGINVRSGCSISDPVIAGLAKGAQVKVLGKATQNGQDLGWYQIEINGGTGFASAAFLTETAPAQTQETAKNTFTGVAKTIYDAAGNAITVYESADGYWYDGAGNQYSWVTTYEFAHIGGSEMYSVNKPVSYEETGIYPIGGAITAYWLNGAPITLAMFSDGNYYSTDTWVQYWDNGNGTYSGSDGSTIYYEPVPMEEGNVYPVYSDGSGRPTVITETDEGYFDAEGNEYYDQGDGTFADDDGATYSDTYNPQDPS